MLFAQLHKLHSADKTRGDQKFQGGLFSQKKENWTDAWCFNIFFLSLTMWLHLVPKRKKKMSTIQLASCLSPTFLHHKMPIRGVTFTIARFFFNALLSAEANNRGKNRMFSSYRRRPHCFELYESVIWRNAITSDRDIVCFSCEIIIWLGRSSC